MERTRRAVLGTLATVGLAGCIDGVLGDGGRSTPSGDGTPTPGETPTGTVATTTTPEESALHAGATIPSHPHAPAEAPSLAAVDHETARPVLTADDVTDFHEPDYVADPFLFVEAGEWHMFFEVVKEGREPNAVIGHATSPDGLEWSYDGVVLRKEYHTSFPLVWKWEGEYYMCPPTGKDVELWRASSFPTDWEFLGNVIEVDFYPHDPAFVRYGGKWWLFTDAHSTDVMVYHNDELGLDGWTPHEGNPVATDRRKAGHMAGRPIVHGDRLLLPLMDNEAHYGHQVRLYEVTDLAPDRYADREVEGSPILTQFGDGWAAEGMHAFDAWWRGPDEGWRCAVDGQRDEVWTIGIVDVPPEGATTTETATTPMETSTGSPTTTR